MYLLNWETSSASRRSGTGTEPTFAGAYGAHLWTISGRDEGFSGVVHEPRGTGKTRAEVLGASVV